MAFNKDISYPPPTCSLFAQHHDTPRSLREPSAAPEGSALCSNRNSAPSAVEDVTDGSPQPSVLCFQACVFADAQIPLWHKETGLWGHLRCCTASLTLHWLSFIRGVVCFSCFWVFPTWWFISGWMAITHQRLIQWRYFVNNKRIGLTLVCQLMVLQAQHSHFSELQGAVGSSWWDVGGLTLYKGHGHGFCRF